MSRFMMRAACTIVAILMSTPTPAFAGMAREIKVRPGGSSWSTPVGSLAIRPIGTPIIFCSGWYMTDDIGGYYESRDWGQTFPESTGDPWNIRAGSVALEAVSYSSSSFAVYAGTGIGGNNGIYRSANSGPTWTPMVTWAGDEQVTDIEAHPSDFTRVFAVTQFWDSDSVANLRYTLSGGTSWSVAPISVPGVFSTAARCLTVSPSGRVYVGCSDSSGGGVYVTNDRGASWTRAELRDDVGITVTDIAFDPRDEDVVYACARAQAAEGVLYKSTDGGETFTALPVPDGASPNTVNIDSIGRVIVGSYTGLIASPYDTGGLMVSNDGGASWTVVGGFAAGYGVITSAIDRFGNAYTGSSSGVTRYWIPTAEEIQGANRFTTAIQVSRTLFESDDSAQCAVIVSGLNFPDAVVAAPLAAARTGALLLSGNTGLPAQSLAELERILPDGGDVVIVGGSNVVPPSVDTLLASKGYAVKRIAGRNRFETSAKVAEEFSSPSACFVANGMTFPDALSASAPAARDGVPILLVGKDAIPAPVDAYLTAHDADLTQGYVCGDVGVVSEAVAARLKNTAESVKRFSGRSRYDTSLAIAQHFYPTPDVAAGLATGLAYPDGLTGSVLSARAGGPLLLVAPSSTPQTYAYLKGGKPSRMMIFGDRAVVPISVRRELEALW